MQHILLAVSGMTPQIITETLYGIHVKSPDNMPEKIIVITTSAGEGKIRNAFSGDNNYLDQFCSDYGYAIPQIDILIPKDGEIPLDDVRTDKEQDLVADYITEQVRHLCKDDAIAIHASLAGGRKTMGFTLGYAMSLFGRPQDSLSHVLVSEPYERVPDFYYPTPYEVKRAEYLDGTRHDLSRAVVTLGEIPLVLMREEVPKDLIEKDNISYTETVNRINLANQLCQSTAEICIDYRSKQVLCNDRPVPMSLDAFAFYAWMAIESHQFPGEGIEPPTSGMAENELNQRLKSWMLSGFEPKLRDELATKDIETIFEAAEDPHSGRSLLKQGKSTDLLLGTIDSQTSSVDWQEEMMKTQKLLWDRLLRETNRSIVDALGKRLAEHYVIKTVNKVKKHQSDKRPVEYKGLVIIPENICFSE